MLTTNQQLEVPSLPDDLVVVSVRAIKIHNSQTYTMYVYVPYVGEQAEVSLNALAIEALVEQGLTVPDNLTIGYGHAIGRNLGLPLFIVDQDTVFTGNADMYLEPEFHKFTAKLPVGAPHTPRGIMVTVDVTNPLHQVVANEQLSSSI